MSGSLISILGVLGIAWYYFCLVKIGTGNSIQNTNPAFYQFMTTSITSVGTSLATFVGMVLGLQSTHETVKEIPGAAIKALEAVRPGSNLDLAPAAQAVQDSVQMLDPTKLQWTAAILYIISLALAIFFWYRRGQATDPAISNLGKSLLGLIAGAMTIMLNLN